MEDATRENIELAIAVVQAGAILLAVIALFFQGAQTRLLRKQIKHAKNQIYVDSFNHFSNNYLTMMAAIPAPGAEQSAIENWWYRYWDVIFAEAHFFRQGFLDRLTFELWMQELARKFDSKPHGAEHMTTFRHSLASRRDLFSGVDDELWRFFDELSRAADPKYSTQHRRSGVRNALIRLQSRSLAGSGQ